MREWQDKAVILRLGHFRENDVWLKVLFAERGVRTVFAFGGAISKRRFCGCLDMFNSLACSVQESRGGEFYNLREAVLLAAPLRLRRNWRAMGMAANCLLFAEALPIGPESAGECFALVEDMRAALERDGASMPMLPMFFRMRMAAALGFAPDLEICAGCGCAVREDAVFLYPEGRIVCVGCAAHLSYEQKKRSLRLSDGSLEVLRAALASMPTGWNAKLFAGRELRQCGRAIDVFVQYHIGLEWENGYFHHV